MPKLLIDGDGVVYRAAFATEKTKYLVTHAEGYHEHDDAKAAAGYAAEHPGAVTWSRKEAEPEDKALMLASVILRDIRDRYPDLEPLIYLSPSVGNFRDVIATRAKYKGNRDAQVRPAHYKAIRNLLVETHGAIEAVGQEADDELGIGMKDFPGSVCVSFDKDLLQIPGKHYNWVTKEERDISPKQAALNFWAQVLSGDPVDNVPGIEGIGPKKAAAILGPCASPTDCRYAALRAYVDKYGQELGSKYFEETAALVWVRRVRNKSWSSP